jgi:hypothetical protein
MISIIAYIKMLFRHTTSTEAEANIVFEIQTKLKAKSIYNLI